MRRTTTHCTTLLAAIVALSATNQSTATTIPGLFNTGVDNSGADLADGALDPHYQLIASDDHIHPPPDAFVFATSLLGTWVPNSSTSKWIAPSPRAANLDGTYIYDLPFSLTGLNPAQATISGAWAMETIGLIYLNGVYVGGTTNLAGPTVLTPFTIPVGSNFVAGVNRLDFVVVNTQTTALTAAAAGLRVEGLSGAAPGIPEPATVVLALIGFGGLFGVRFHTGRGLRERLSQLGQ